MRPTAVVLVAGLLWPCSSFSQTPEQRMNYAFKTGNELLENCSAPPSTGPYVACFSYISGVADTLSMMKIACTSPLGGNERQMTDLVANRLRAHPEIRHYAAAGEVLLALKDNFPYH
jgi:Rap1a immunity proteins